MGIDNAEEDLFSVLKMIQASCGLDCPELSGQTKPALELPDFDSKVWPVAAGLLGNKIGCEIPPEENLFCEKDKSGQLIYRTINQIIDYVKQLLEKGPQYGATK